VGLLTPGAIAAVDATGLDARHASTHYRYGYSPAYCAAYAQLHVGGAPAPPHRRPGYPKLTIVIDTRSHLIVGALPGWGPSHDTPALAPHPLSPGHAARVPPALYAERQQVESVFSRDKRRLGAALTARSRATLAAEQVLRVVTHNLLILHWVRCTFNRATVIPSGARDRPGHASETRWSHS
jgi:hypothetical protein